MDGGKRMIWVSDLSGGPLPQVISSNPTARSSHLRKVKKREEGFGKNPVETMEPGKKEELVLRIMESVRSGAVGGENARETMVRPLPPWGGTSRLDSDEQEKGILHPTGHLVIPKRSVDSLMVMLDGKESRRDRHKKEEGLPGRQGVGGEVKSRRAQPVNPITPKSGVLMRYQ